VTRIVSLLPAATEMVAALGAQSSLVGISHECDYPPGITHLPRVTATPIDPSLPSGAIDGLVRRDREQGRPVIGVNAAQLRRLAPDLIITQDLCEVCAVADGEVHRLARAMATEPAVVSLGARDLAGIWRDIDSVARALGVEGRGRGLVDELAARIERGVFNRQDGKRPRVVCIEWLDPLYLAGHWVPEMVAAAGGLDVGALPGSHSEVHPWDRLAELEPDVVLVMLCGFGTDRSHREVQALAAGHPLANLRCPIWILDGNAYTSRPGPRVVEGVDLMRSAFEGTERPGLMRVDMRSGVLPTPLYTF
jgi:iron complex transport system substrate-binding protein